MRHRPPTLRNPMVRRNSSSTFSPLLKSQHRPIAVANATSWPAVTAMSRKSNCTGLACQVKNVSHVAIYASNPRDENGGGTSNIKTSGSWSARIPATSWSRTALDHRPIRARSSASSVADWRCFVSVTPCLPFRRTFISLLNIVGSTKPKNDDPSHPRVISRPTSYQSPPELAVP
jgi:hypothetical protein